MLINKLPPNLRFKVINIFQHMILRVSSLSWAQLGSSSLGWGHYYNCDQLLC